MSVTQKLKDLANLADRKNEQKIRFELLPDKAITDMARVMTAGAVKYSDDNWRKGLQFRSVLGSLERHMRAFKSGEDNDPETGISHMAHVMCNAAFLIEYVTTHPELDDRIK